MAKISMRVIAATLAVATVTTAGGLGIRHSTAATTVPSMCAKNEEVVFGCAQGAKLISLCATATPNGPTKLRYVYGAKGKPELEITDPAAFSAGITGLSGGGIDFVRVKTADFAYVVYTGESPGWSQDGWVIEHNGAPISHHVCKRGATGPDVWGPVYAAKLPQAPDDQAFNPPGWTGAKPSKHGR